MIHTKGNWFARIDEYGVDVVVEKTGFGIADIGTRKSLKDANYPNEQAEANAKLMAAAPELLEACINALKDVQKLNKGLIKEGKHGFVLMETELDNAIKKATS